MQEWLETYLPNVADSFPVLQQSILETLQRVLAAARLPSSAAHGKGSQRQSHI